MATPRTCGMRLGHSRAAGRISQLQPPTGPSPKTTRLVKCGDCGGPMSADDRFCPSCGTAYGEAPTGRSASRAEIRVSIGIATGFRFGVGLALGALVVWAVATLIALILAGAAVRTVVSGFEATGASTFSGTGPAVSQPVQLRGIVDVIWTAAPTSAGPCRHQAAIYADGRPNTREVLVDRDVSSESTGTHVLYGLVSSEYVVDVKSTCSWTFRFKPRS